MGFNGTCVRRQNTGTGIVYTAATGPGRSEHGASGEPYQPVSFCRSSPSTCVLYPQGAEYYGPGQLPDITTHLFEGRLNWSEPFRALFM